MGSGSNELAQSAMAELQRQEQRNENTHRDKILLALLKHYHEDEAYDASYQLIELVDDDEYARTLADKEPTEQFNYHYAITAIADHFTSGSGKNANKAVKYLQRGISVIGDEKIRLMRNSC